MTTSLTRRFDNIFNTRPVFDGFDQLFDMVFYPDSLHQQQDSYKFRHDADKICIDIAMPGVKKNAVDIKVKDGQLSVSRAAHEDDKHGFSAYASQHSWRLSNSYDIEGIEATMEDGILTITVPKKPELAAKVIQVK